MTEVDFVVTLNEEAMERQWAGEAAYNLDSVVHAVPTAKIVSGQGTESLHVSVNAMYSNQLRTAVAGLCIVDDYGELLPYGRHSVVW